MSISKCQTLSTMTLVTWVLDDGSLTSCSHGIYLSTVLPSRPPDYCRRCINTWTYINNHTFTAGIRLRLREVTGL